MWPVGPEGGHQENDQAKRQKVTEIAVVITSEVLRAGLGVTEAEERPDRQPAGNELHGVWLDADQGVLIEIGVDQQAGTTLKLYGATQPIWWKGDGAAETAGGLTFALHGRGDDRVLEVTAGDDPFGNFHRSSPWRPDRVAAYTGQYTCPEVPGTWSVDATSEGLRVAHHEEHTFAPVAPDTFSDGAVTLRFSRRASEFLMVVDFPRATGFTFERG